MFGSGKRRRERLARREAAAGVSWKQALTWTAGVALAGAAMRVVARRLTASGWEKATGEPPPA